MEDTLEELLRTPGTIHALPGGVQSMFVNWLLDSTDAELVEITRNVIATVAIRMAGDNPSAEGAVLCVTRTIELIKESLQ